MPRSKQRLIDWRPKSPWSVPRARDGCPLPARFPAEGGAVVLNWIIDVALRNRFLVVLGALAFAVAGGIPLRHLDIDAFPDTTPVQVQVNTIAPALAPEEVEQQITFPLEQVLGGLPRLELLRSVS